MTDGRKNRTRTEAPGVSKGRFLSLSKGSTTRSRSRNTRSLRRGLAVLAVTAVGSGLLVGPSSAEPDIGDVQDRVHKLYRQAEQASERYNDARLELKKSRDHLTTLRHDLNRQQHKVQRLRSQVMATVVDQYEGSSMSSTSKALLSQDPDAFLSRLTTVSAYRDDQRQQMVAFATEMKRLKLRREDAQAQVKRLAKTKDKLAENKHTVDAKAAAAKDLLGELKAKKAAREKAAREAAARKAAREAAAQRASRDAQRQPVDEPAPAQESSPAPAPVSGSAAAAVSYARAHVGDAYVYGAAGPSSFDCSGLTMMAWRAAGVSLPHSSSAQMSAGTPVSSGNLQPGDLVFYYSPVSHVGIYIGNGQIVHAANPSTDVAVAGVFSMPFSGAVRPG